MPPLRLCPASEQRRCPSLHHFVQDFMFLTPAPSANIQDGRIELCGATVAYTISGDGPALMLVHGLGGSRHTWRHLIGGLSRTHTVIAPDLPDHGESDPLTGDYSLGAHACALRALLLAPPIVRLSAGQDGLVAAKAFRYADAGRPGFA